MDTVLIELGKEGSNTGLCLTRILSLDPSETIELVASSGNDLYVGTSNNFIYRYTQCPKSGRFHKTLEYQCENLPRKLILLSRSHILLVLAGNECIAFPCSSLSTGFLKAFREVVDVLVAPPLESDKEPSPEKVLVLRLGLVKFLLFSDSKASSVSEASYNGALGGMAMQTLGKSIVYNEKVYELMDTTTKSTTTLFEYGMDNHMVPFASDSTSPYEYLLSIQPDSEAAMAMFVDEQGNATRGTLLWLQHGRPTGGIAVLWPMVYGVFNSIANGNNRLVGCSLETLEEVFSCPLEDVLGRYIQHADDTTAEEFPFGISSVEALAINREVACLQRPKQPVSGSSIRSQGKILVYQRNHIWLMHSESMFECLVRAFDACTDTNVDAFVHQLYQNLKVLHDTELLFCMQLLAVLQMYLGRTEDAQLSLLRQNNHGLIVDSKAAQYVLGRDQMHVDDTFPAIANALERFPSEPVGLGAYFVQALSICTDTATCNEIRGYAYKLLPRNSVADFLECDLYWTRENTHNDEMIRLLQERGMSEALIVACDRLIEDGDARPEISEQFCQLLLEQHQSVPEITVSNVSKVLERVRNVTNETVYSKIMIDMLEVNKDATIQFLRKNKRSPFSNVHRDLLLRLGSDDSGNDTVAQLKVEYLESLIDDRGCRAQLYVELLALARAVYDPACAANFDILKAAFLVENCLANSVWPKLTWPDFLAIAGPHSECAEFVVFYLKLYELTLVDSVSPSYMEDDAFKYFCFFADKDSVIRNLLQWSDYTTAEFYAVHGHAPFPKAPFYPTLETASDTKGRSDAINELCDIFSFYVESYRLKHQNIHCIQHFLAAYGKSVFSAGQILAMLPEDLPLVYVKSYFDSLLVTGSKELGSQHLCKHFWKISLRRDKSLNKVLQK